MDDKFSYYVNLILRTHRGYKNGIPCNAKPLYLLSIIAGIKEKILFENKFIYNASLIELYKKTCLYFEPDKQVSPFYRPYFHLISDHYYSINWKPGIFPPTANKPPSSKYLRENAEFAKLDPDFWILLQNVFVREEIQDTIIKHFLND